MNYKMYMLATDLDGTLVGDEEALRKLLFHYHKLKDKVALVYVTGRHLTSAMSLIETEKLPKPDFLITDVGTAIYRTDQFVEDEEWKQIVQNGWQPQAVIERAISVPTLVRQKLPHNRRVSFTIQPDDVAWMELENILLKDGIAHQMIISSHRDVDILPEKSGKGNALTYIIEKYANQDVQVLVAGDSGNDLDMLTLGYPAVIVGNAQPELISIDVSYPHIYRAQQNCAAGIMEAWNNFYGHSHLQIG